MASGNSANPLEDQFIVNY